MQDIHYLFILGLFWRSDQLCGGALHLPGGRGRRRRPHPAHRHDPQLLPLLHTAQDRRLQGLNNDGRTDENGKICSVVPHRILQRKLKYFLCCFRDDKLKFDLVDISNNIHNISISAVHSCVIVTLPMNSKCTKECESPFVHKRHTFPILTLLEYSESEAMIYL